nr:hypothetical protein [Staphylococcus cohnii]
MGYVLSTPHLIEQVTAVHLYNSICVATPSQYGAISALKHGDEDIKKMSQAYVERRNYIYIVEFKRWVYLLKNQKVLFIFFLILVNIIQIHLNFVRSF